MQKSIIGHGANFVSTKVSEGFLKGNDSIMLLGKSLKNLIPGPKCVNDPEEHNILSIHCTHEELC